MKRERERDWVRERREREWGKDNKINTKQMKECLSSGSYLHRQHLLYHSTINKKVTSEQNINMAAAEATQRAAVRDRTADSDHLMVLNQIIQYVQMFLHQTGLCVSKRTSRKAFIYYRGWHFLFNNITCHLIWMWAAHAAGSIKTLARA